MSASAVSSIALLTPIVASNAVFSSRRASRGLDSIEENPLYGVANMNIAAAQVLKGGRAIKAADIALMSEPNIITEGAKSFISNKNVASFTNALAKNPVVKTTGNVLSYTANHINPIIVGTSAIKIGTSDDKVDTWARESTSLLTMFGAEEATKKLIGMPIVTNKKGKDNVQFRQAGITKYVKKILSENQYNKVQKCIEKNKATKIAMATGKGLIFATNSVVGYKAGNKIAGSILGEKND